MKAKYYSCVNREELNKVFNFDGNSYADFDLAIDVIGKINLNPLLEPIGEDENGLPVYPEDTREPQWSDFLFNVIFLNDNKVELFENFKEETPKTPFRTFLI